MEMPPATAGPSFCRAQSSSNWAATNSSASRGNCEGPGDGEEQGVAFYQRSCAGLQRVVGEQAGAGCWAHAPQSLPLEVLESMGSTGASVELGTHIRAWHGREQVLFCPCLSASPLENRGTCRG